MESIQQNYHQSYCQQYNTKTLTTAASSQRFCLATAAHESPLWNSFFAKLKKLNHWVTLSFHLNQVLNSVLNQTSVKKTKT